MPDDPPTVIFGRGGPWILKTWLRDDMDVGSVSDERFDEILDDMIDGGAVSERIVHGYEYVQLNPFCMSTYMADKRADKAMDMLE